jgi:hypothetical protein
VNGGSKTEIKAAQIAEHLRNADALVTKVDWAAKKAPPAPGNLYRERLLASAAATPSASLIEAIKNIRKDGSSIVDKAEHRVLHDVRRGIQIGYAVAEEYRRTVGIENVGDLSKISPEQKGVIQEKMRTAAALSLYTLARYVSEGLADVGDDQAHKEHVVLPECALDNPIAAAKCALYYLSLNLAHPSVSNDKALNATVYLFFRQVLDEIEARKASFTYLESFQSIAFGIEGEDFTVEDTLTFDDLVSAIARSKLVKKHAAKIVRQFVDSVRETAAKRPDILGPKTLDLMDQVERDYLK